jgi:hypothetical protein
MATRAGDPKAQPPSLGRRLQALGVLALAAALYAYLVSRPVATVRPGDQPWAPLKPGESLALVLPASGTASRPIFSFNGPLGRNVVIDVAEGALGPEAPSDLTDLYPQALGRTVPILWQLKDGGDSRAIVDIGLKPVGAQPPRLTLLPHNDPNSAELQLEADNAQLQIVMSGVATNGRNAPAALLAITNPADPVQSPKPLSVPGGGALPIPVTVPPGTPVTIRYPQDAASGPTGAGFTLGPDRSGLTVVAVAIEPPAGPSGPPGAIAASRLYACGAPPKDPRQLFALAAEASQIVWLGGLDGAACRPTMDVALDKDHFTPMIHGGPAFLAVDGKAQALSWQWVKSNPFLITFLAGIPTGLSAWAFHIVCAPLLFGKWRGAKPRRRSARPPSRRGARAGGA